MRAVSAAPHRFHRAATLHIANDAPLEVAEAAYRALVKQAHPDVAGAASHPQMVALNAAIELNGDVISMYGSMAVAKRIHSTWKTANRLKNDWPAHNAGHQATK